MNRCTLPSLSSEAALRRDAQAATSEQAQAYYLQTHDDPAWQQQQQQQQRRSKPAPAEHTPARTDTNTSADLDLSTVRGPRLGVLAAARAVKSKWDAKDTLTHYIKELPAYYTQKALDERETVQTKRLLDVTTTTHPPVRNSITKASPERREREATRRVAPFTRESTDRGDAGRRSRATTWSYWRRRACWCCAWWTRTAVRALLKPDLKPISFLPSRNAEF